MSGFNVRHNTDARDVALLAMKKLALGHEYEQEVIEIAAGFIKRQRNKYKPFSQLSTSDWERIIRNTEVYCKAFILEEL